MPHKDLGDSIRSREIDDRAYGIITFYRVNLRAQTSRHFEILVNLLFVFAIGLFLFHMQRE
jgi:hypothetical protein